MRAASRLRVVFIAVALAATAISGSFAQQLQQTPIDVRGPIVKPHPRPIPMPSLLPVPGFSASPTATPRPGGTLPLPRRTAVPGRGVSLSQLPPLPPKTLLNSANFSRSGQGRVHPMAANGGTIWYYEDQTANAACNSNISTIVPVGCDLYWYSNFLPNNGHTYQDYFISENALSSSATAEGSPYTGTSSSSTNYTPNLTSGIYVLATLDTTANRWVVVTYVTVGTLPFLGTYADSTAKTPSDQFIASSSTTVYFQATGLTNNDYYVIYVESTAKTISCAYIAPSGTLNATGMCDPTTSTGTPALSSPPTYPTPTINLNWTLNTSLASGTYNVVLWDLTAHQRVQQAQISILASGTSASMSLTPVSGNSSITTFKYAPTPPPTPYSATNVFAFDNQQEQSDKGWSMKTTGLSSGTYTVTLTDPTGEVVNQTTTSASGGAVSWNMPFYNTQSPTNYFAHSYAVEVYNTSTSTVAYSQGFSILGYNAATDFANGTSSMVLASGQTNVPEGLQFTNDGESYYGTGNADTISGIAIDTGGQGIQVTLSGVTPTSCGGNCSLYTTTATDTSGQTWNVTDECDTATGNGGCTIVARPATSGQSLALGGTLSIPGTLWTNSVGSHCTSGCQGTTSILPTHGESWSSTSQSWATNPIYFTNGQSNPPAGTASITHYGYVDGFGNLLATGQIAHEYTAPNTQMTYTQSSPWTPTSGYGDEWHVIANNTSAAGGATISELEIKLPTAYVAGNTTVLVDQNLSPGWTTTACPSGYPSTAWCVTTANGNAGIAPGGSSDIYLQVWPLPATSFTYANGGWVVQAVKSTVFPLTDGGATASVFVGSPSTESALDTAAYSLTSSRITPGFNPTSEGYNTNNSVSITLTNATGTSSDPNPDYIDAFTVDLPYHSYTNITMPAGWYSNSQDISGTTTRYWFYECAAQFATADGPVAAPPAPNPTLPNCGSAYETTYSVAPGSTLTVTGNLSVGTSNVTATTYAHGANGGGWTTGTNFTLSVTSVAASAGFFCEGVIPCTTTNVTSPNSASVGADSDTTLGNGFGYSITNNSSGGQNITSAVITIPGKDVSNNTPADGTGSPNTPWTITATPTISGSAYGCSITSFSSAQQSGTNGAINIGGGGCSIPPNSTITILFTAKAPYVIGTNYKFPTTVNGTVAAAERFPVDTIVAVVLSAQLTVTVDPAPDPTPLGSGSNPIPSCANCSFNPSNDEIDFGSIPASSTSTASDAARVNLYTNAGPTVSWNLYVSTNNNPSNNGSAGYPTNELLTSVDRTASLGGQTIGGLTFNTTSYTVVPSPQGATSLTMASSSGLTSARRAPIGFVTNFEVSIGAAGSTTAQTSTVIYTFISN